MARIKIKGYSELIEIEDSIARPIKIKWENGEYDNGERISFGSIACLAGDIRAIIVGKEEQRVDSYVLQRKEEEKKREAFLSLTISEKAEKQEALFNLFYRASMGEAPTKEKAQAAVDIARTFFLTNKERAVIDVLLWKELLPVADRSLNQYEVAVLKSIERLLSADMSDASKSNYENELLKATK